MNIPHCDSDGNAINAVLAKKILTHKAYIAKVLKLQSELDKKVQEYNQSTYGSQNARLLKLKILQLENSMRELVHTRCQVIELQKKEEKIA